MATTTARSVVPHLRRLLGADSAGPTDGALLERFIASRDGDAFAVLVQRHGPMVLGVCRRVLGNVHDAEDAFQATFLVLARKAASLAGGGGLANWLYGVACRTALKARTAACRRRGRVQPVIDLPDIEAPTHETADDLLPHLDAELSRLPDVYRQAIVMCDLCGMTQKDAARRAGCPEGTLSSRLTRGRALLARRLRKRGIALTGGALATALARECSAGTLPPALLRSTVDAATELGSGSTIAAVSSKAVALSEGVMKSMLLGKLKALAAGAALVGVVLVGIVLVQPAGVVEGQVKPPSSELPSAPKERLPEGVILRLGVAERQTAGDQIAITPDGKSIVGVRGSRYVRVWDRATGKLRESGELPIEWPRMANVISSDGRYFVTSGERHDAVVLWDLAQKKKVHEWVLERGKQHYLLVAFS